MSARKVPPPTDAEVAQAWKSVDIEFDHELAPPTPALSANRCAWLCKWMRRAQQCEHVFGAPVRHVELGLHDYLQFVPLPMDLSLIEASLVCDTFNFSRFLDWMRLMFANACRYNPPDNPLHVLSRRLEAAFDHRVRTMQAAADASEDDKDVMKICTVLHPLIGHLIQRADAAAFVSPVDTVQYPHYLDVIVRPMCLQDVSASLEACEYVHREDVRLDVELIWVNAMCFNVVGEEARLLRDVCARLFSKRMADFGEKFFVACAHRDRALRSFEALTNECRLTVVEELRRKCPDAIFDYQNGTSDFCISALCAREFVWFDTRVRQMQVQRDLA